MPRILHFINLNCITGTVEQLSRTPMRRLEACLRHYTSGCFPPNTEPRVRLKSGHWLVDEKVKGQGVPPNFPYGLRF